MSDYGINARAVCRTCVRRSYETRSVHSELRLAGNNVRLSDILSAFFKYEVDENDGLPQNICLLCVHQLTATYSFGIIIQDSWSKLTKAEAQSSSHDDQINDQADFDSDNDNKPLVSIKQNPSIKCEPADKKCVVSKKLYCVRCKVMFMTDLALLQHCTAHHQPKNSVGRVCEFCNERFNGFHSLIKHRMYHFSLHVCEVCWKGFDDLEALNIHKCEKTAPEMFNTEPEKLLRQCDQCGKSYPSSYFNIHMRIHSSNRPYKCLYCPKRFKVPCSLNSHILWSHKKSRTHKCDMCESTFVTSSARSAHKRKHHLLEKKHACESCGKKFFAKSDVKKHMLTHTGAKNFHCQQCDKSYQTRYGLNVHLRSHSHSIST